jgi:hypothetical protein
LEDSEFYLGFLISADIAFYPLTPALGLGFLGLVLLLIGSAMISGSEIAFFSLSPGDLHEIEKKAVHRAGGSGDCSKTRISYWRLSLLQIIL